METKSKNQKKRSRKMKKLENKLQKEEETEQGSNKNLDDVWAAINELRQENNDLRKLLEQAHIEMNNLRPLGSTIMVIGENAGTLQNGSCSAVLSSDRSKWIELHLEFPYLPRESGAIYFNEEIYVFGGMWDDKVLFKLDTNLEWIRLADMNIGRSCITNSCLELDGYIWVFGGCNNEKKYLKSVERYDPKEDKWTLMPDMVHARYDAAAMLWNGRIVVSGGRPKGDTSSSCSEIECFNPEDNCWTELPGLPCPLHGHALVTYKKKIIAMGGYDGSIVRGSTWEIDPRETTPTWKFIAFMKYPRGKFATAVIGKDIYAIGGCGVYFGPHDEVQVYDGKEWREGPCLSFEWCNMSALIIPQSLADQLCYYNTQTLPPVEETKKEKNKCIISYFPLYL